MPGALVCCVLYYVIWYWLSGLPTGEAAGYVFLSLLTFEVFEVSHTLIRAHGEDPSNHPANRNKLTGSLRPIHDRHEPRPRHSRQRPRLPRLLRKLVQRHHSPVRADPGLLAVLGKHSPPFPDHHKNPAHHISTQDSSNLKQQLYWLNPFTYLLGGLVTAVIKDQPVTCKQQDLYLLSPPANQTCGEYLSSWAKSAQAQLLNPDATESCRLCEYTTGNQYLKAFRLGGGENGGIWGNWAIFVLFTVSNLFLVYFTTWATKVHKWKKEPQVVKESDERGEGESS